MRPYLDRVIRLIPKNESAKVNVLKCGEYRKVLSETDKLANATIPPDSGYDKPGPWIFITPMGASMYDDNAMWIHATSDNNFKVSLEGFIQ